MESLFHCKRQWSNLLVPDMPHYGKSGVPLCIWQVQNASLWLVQVCMENYDEKIEAGRSVTPIVWFMLSIIRFCAESLSSSDK